MKPKVLAALLLALWLNGCGDKCRSYSDFSCAEIEKADYSVYFYNPGGTEEYLGHAIGTAECEDVASSYAYSKNMSRADWGYVCCMRANGSECYEKHR